MSGYVSRAIYRRRIVFTAIIAVCALGSTAYFLFLKDSSNASPSGSRRVSKQEILSKWTNREWDAVLTDCVKSLELEPLDQFYLGFRGMAAFYKGSELPEGEGRSSLMDEAIISIRKALTGSNRSARGLPRGELEYILGKAYYNKSAFFWDLSAKYLEQAIIDGYLGADSYEYLGLAHAGLGDQEAAIRNFQLALGVKRSDLLLLAAAKAYSDAGQTERSESLLIEAISSTTDAIAREKARFALIDLLAKKGETSRVVGQLEDILKENPESAEAHYRLGLEYAARGDPVRARAEWRDAISYDPMHLAARQRLTEKF